MHLRLAFLALSATLANAFDVYIHPASHLPTLKSPGKDGAAALVSHHLGLDMFEPLPRKAAFLEQVNGDFVGKGAEKRSAALVITSTDGLKGASTLKNPVMSFPDSIMTEADEIIDIFVDRAKSVYDTIAHYPSVPSPAVSSFTVYDLRSTPLAFSVVEDILATSWHVVIISSSPSTTEKREVSKPRIPPQFPLTSVTGCYTSYESCTNATDGCSGHGSCAVASREGKSCYSCACEASKENDGKKTVYWAGASCEKKDVSGPFAIIAGIVLVLFLVGVGSVSLLYSIGDVELPSTLLAGSGAPKRD